MNRENIHNQIKELCSKSCPILQMRSIEDKQEYAKEEEHMLLLLLNHFRRVRLCATPQTAAHQDAYAELEAIWNIGTPAKTAVCILADKEEIGSVGISGMKSFAFETFMNDMCESTGASLYRCFENSFCLSADVSNAFDPNFAEVSDRRNNSQLNYGISICKYTGSRGKGGASDASAEAMAHVRSTFDSNGVIWQIATLGKVDQGGGGTVAAYMADRNIVTVDAGVPVLSMHAPLELVSKLDCYETYLGCKAIYLA